jgi:enoyl-CoA hydratase/carnithine racemase
MTNSLLLETDGAIAVLTINDAPYNRMSLEFVDELGKL